MNLTDQSDGSSGAGDLSRRTPPAVLMIAYTNYVSDPRVIRMAEAARDGGFSVDVIALKDHGQARQEVIRGIRVYKVQAHHRGGTLRKYLWEYAKFFLRSTAISAHLFLTRRYRVVHVHNMPDALVFSSIVPKMFGAKVILDIHDPMPETYSSKFRNHSKNLVSQLLLLQERLSAAFVDQTITVSDPVKDGILIAHGYSPERIGVIGNFADDNIFRPLDVPTTNGVMRFVFHGLIAERNGLRTLVEAVAQIRNLNKIRIRIIGEGDFSSTLHALIQARGLNDVIEFVNQSYPVYEIPKLLSDCHVGLVPLDIATSTVANFALPLKLVEYACLGLPSISIHNAAIDYYFGLDECMFFKSGDAASLAQVMLQVAEDPNILIPYRKELAKVRKRLLWSKEKEKYVSMLKSLTYEKEGASLSV